MKKTVSFTRQSVNVFFHILTRCNLRCGHCYINPGQHGSKTLSITAVENWLKLFRSRSGDRPAHLVLLGGEPTLHPGLPKAVRTARRLGYASITVDTNGYLFHRILEKVGPEEVDVFSFSLDGPSPDINDAIRGRGSYEACIAGIRKAVSLGFSTSLITTISRDNLHSLKEMPAFLEQLGVQRFFIQVLGIRGRSALGQRRPASVSKEQWESEVPAAAEDAASRGVTSIYPKVFLKPEETFECAGRVADNYFIFPNGRVYRCPVCEDHPLHTWTVERGRLIPARGITESALFELEIPEGCVMSRLVQPETLRYDAAGRPEYRIACCMLKEEVRPF